MVDRRMAHADARAAEAEAKVTAMEARYANFVRVICDSSEDRVLTIRKTLMADVQCWASVKNVREETVACGLCGDADRAAEYQGARRLFPIPALNGFIDEHDLLAVSAVSTVLRTTLAETCGKHVFRNYADQLRTDHHLVQHIRDRCRLEANAEELRLCEHALGHYRCKLFRAGENYHVQPWTTSRHNHKTMTVARTVVAHMFHPRDDRVTCVPVRYTDAPQGDLIDSVKGEVLIEGPCRCEACHAIHGIGPVGYEDDDEDGEGEEEEDEDNDSEEEVMPPAA